MSTEIAEKTLLCCVKGRNIKWHDTSDWNGPDQSAYAINLNETYPDPAYEVIRYCPFCGKQVPSE